MFVLLLCSFTSNRTTIIVAAVVASHRHSNGSNTTWDRATAITLTNAHASNSAAAVAGAAALMRVMLAIILLVSLIIICESAEARCLPVNQPGHQPPASSRQLTPLARSCALMQRNESPLRKRQVEDAQRKQKALCANSAWNNNNSTTCNAVSKSSCCYVFFFDFCICFLYMLTISPHSLSLFTVRVAHFGINSLWELFAFVRCWFVSGHLRSAANYHPARCGD